MPTYEIQFNVHTVGSDPTSYSGHANVSFVVDGVVQLTVGGQAILGAGILSGEMGPLDGVMQIENLGPGSTNGFVSQSVPVTALQYATLFDYAQDLGASEARYNYSLFSRSCVNFAQHIYELTNHPGHFGDLFSQSERGASPVWVSIPFNQMYQAGAYPGPNTPLYDPTGPIPWTSVPEITPFALDGVVFTDTVDWTLTQQNLFNTYGSSVVWADINAEFLMAREIPSFRPEFIEKYGDLIAFVPYECFPAGTTIRMADGTEKPIEAIAVGDLVQSFDGQGQLVPGRVSQLLNTVTTEWLQLSNGTVVTPGHRFLRPDGTFAEIAEILADDGRIVAEDGAAMTVTAQRIVYDRDTAHLFETDVAMVYASEGGNALAPQPKEGWRTYNFTVEHHHTYIADRIRVHNDSVLTALQTDDLVISLTTDLSDAAVLRDTNGDGTREVVIIDGENFGGTIDTYIEAEATFIPTNPGADVEALVNAYIANNPAAARFVSDPGLGNDPGDGVPSDDIIEILTDDIGGTFTARTFGGVNIPTLDELLANPLTAADTLSGLVDQVNSLAVQDLVVGSGSASFPAFVGMDPLAVLAFLMGVDLDVEIVPAVTTTNPLTGATIVLTPAVTLGDILSDMLDFTPAFNIVLPEGVTPSDVTQSQDGDNLLLTLDTGDGGASVLTFEGVYADGTTNEVAAVIFADGTSVPLDQIATTPVGDGVVTGTAAAELIDATYADSDSDAVSDGDDQVAALGGDDTMAGGLGNDTLDGGEGTDEVLLSGTVLDFAFAHDGVLTVRDTNTADGTDEGTDTLIDVESLRFSDGSTAQIAMVSSGLMVTMYASGSTQASTRKVFDVNNAYAWSEYTQTFGADGQRTAQTNTYDDGRVIDYTFTDGIRSTALATDVDNAYAWDTYAITYDANGDKATQTTTYDDGRVIDYTFTDGVRSTATATDADIAYAWASYDITYDANGDKAGQTTYYDDGRIAETTFAGGVRQTRVITDVEDAFVWSTVEQTFDAAGVRSEQTNTYDDGRVLERTFVNGISSLDVMTDVADAYSWASYTDTYDPSGERVQRVMIYDDGSEVITNYLDLVLG